MIDLACVFTTGGVLLFQMTFCQLKFDILDRLIKERLIKERSADEYFHCEPYMVKWKLANDIGLVFVVVYQEFFQLQFIEDLLDIFKQNFIKANELLNSNTIWIPDFSSHFEASYTQWQVLILLQNYIKSKEKGEKQMRSFHQTEKGKQLHEQTELKIQQQDPQHVKDVKNILKEKFQKKKISTDVETEKTEKTEKKEGRNWGIANNVSSRKMQQLDANQSHKTGIQVNNQYFETTDQEKVMLKQFDDSDDEEEEQKPKGLLHRLSNRMSQFTGNKVIDNEDLDQILIEIKNQLMSKNVAEEIAASLMSSLRSQLLQTKTKAFTSVQNTVKTSLRASLTKILTNSECPDLIQNVLQSRSSGRPYVLTFIGVNGVGKSTNLAKVAYLLKNNGFSVMLVACDNFRAGAVEQIKQHGRNLTIPVFDCGYKEDAADIAFKAIQEATHKKIDVVLIDTAGRMQDNEPLMKALSRLVAVNRPDMVIFIGEALAGNDSIDQLKKFNKSMMDMANRPIDAVILSKFDTVDDKIGTAISMTYCTGKPILFVGVGQKYPHLRKLNARVAVNSLLS